MSLAKKLDKVLELALSGESRVKTLAIMSGDDVFSFYEGASLVGLDLSGQDLTGLNFYSADLRRTVLDNVIYSRGAFNGAYLDQRFNNLQDEYEFTLAECADGLIQRIHFFGTFRPDALDAVLDVLAIKNADFANLAGISTATLRSARRSKRVSMETIKSINQAVLHCVAEATSPLGLIETSSFLQPLIAFTYISASGWQRPLNRREVGWILRMMAALDTKTKRYENQSYAWRENPGLIAWIAIHLDAIDFEDKAFEEFALEMRNSTAFGDPAIKVIEDLLSA
jgi:hypothetical protein